MSILASLYEHLLQENNIKSGVQCKPSSLFIVEIQHSSRYRKYSVIY